MNKRLEVFVFIDFYQLKFNYYLESFRGKLSEKRGTTVVSTLLTAQVVVKYQKY